MSASEAVGRSLSANTQVSPPLFSSFVRGCVIAALAGAAFFGSGCAAPLSVTRLDGFEPARLQGRPPATDRRGPASDPYRQLEDLASARPWQEAQDRYTEEEFAKSPSLPWVEKQLRVALARPYESAPEVRGDRTVFERRGAQEQKSGLWVRDGKGEARLLVDPNTWDAHDGLGQWTLSPDGKLLAYGRKTGGADVAQEYVVEVATGKQVGEPIPECFDGLSWWGADGALYVQRLPMDASIPDDKRFGHLVVMRHVLNRPVSEDVAVTAPTRDPRKPSIGAMSSDGKHLFHITFVGGVSGPTELRWRPIDPTGKGKADLPLTVITRGIDGYNDPIDVLDNTLYVLTNAGAPNRKVISLELGVAGAQWRDAIPESPEAVLEAARVAGGKLVLQYTREGSSELRVVSPTDPKTARIVALPEPGAIGELSGDAASKDVYFSFSNLATRASVLHFSTDGGPVEQVSNSASPRQIPLKMKRLEFPSEDGTLVTMFLVHRADHDFSKPGTVTLYAYGAFGISQLPDEQPHVLPLLEADSMYGVVQARGGNEKGGRWHDLSVGPNKVRTYQDVRAARQALVAQGIVRPDGVALMGWSSGGTTVLNTGLLWGGDFGAVVADAPLAELRRMTKISKGLGRLWVAEYEGGPSPYDLALKATVAPPTLVTVAANDPRNGPQHAFKVVAALQGQHAQSSKPYLLSVEDSSAHAGASGVDAAVRKRGRQLAFIMDQLKIEVPK